LASRGSVTSPPPSTPSQLGRHARLWRPQQSRPRRLGGIVAQLTSTLTSRCQRLVARLTSGLDRGLGLNCFLLNVIDSGEQGPDLGSILFVSKNCFFVSADISSLHQVAIFVSVCNSRHKKTHFLYCTNCVGCGGLYEKALCNQHYKFIL
jgi:hypothetical protein